MEHRHLYLDLLRVIAIFAVITLHVSAPIVVSFSNIPSNHWMIANIIDSITRFCVPVFFMISGALLLGDDRNYQFSYLFRKRILRIFIPFLIWSFFYIFYMHFYVKPYANLFSEVFSILNHPAMYHLWFIYPLIGLYILLPLLGTFVTHAEESKIRYFLILWGIVAILNPLLNILFSYQPPIFSLPNNIQETWLYTGYFVLGFYLSRNPFYYNKWLPIFLIISGIMITVFATDYFSHKYAKFYEFFYSYMAPNVLMVSVGVFLIIKMAAFKLETLKPLNRSLLIKLSEASFGIYLMHVFFIYQANMILHLDGNTFHPLIGVFLTSFFVFVVSAALTYLIRQISFVGRFIA